MARAYRMAEDGALNLQERIDIGVEDRCPGSGVLQFHDPGLQPTIRDLITQMIVTSDNTATDILIKKLGGRAPINTWLSETGFPKMQLLHTPTEWFRLPLLVADADANELTSAEVFAITARRVDSESRPVVAKVRTASSTEISWTSFARRMAHDRDLWLGALTARETGRFLEALQSGALASPGGSAQMLAMMRWQQLGARRIPHYVNYRYEVAHKTGDCPPTLAHDAGIVYLTSGPTVIVFLGDDIDGDFGEAEDLMGQIGREIMDYFDGGASA
jgi:beta-lactamase class A